MLVVLVLVGGGDLGLLRARKARHLDALGLERGNILGTKLATTIAKLFAWGLHHQAGSEKKKTTCA